MTFLSLNRSSVVTVVHSLLRRMRKLTSGTRWPSRDWSLESVMTIVLEVRSPMKVATGRSSSSRQPIESVNAHDCGWQSLCRRAASLRPLGIREDPVAQAAPFERAPFTLRLREPVGDRIQHRGVDAEAAMAADHLDVLGVIGRRLDTALPRDDAVRAAEDRCHRHRRRLLARLLELRVVDA